MSPDATLERDAIARRIPHQGRMCLLDRVLHWSASAIECEAWPDPGDTHPLRHEGALSAVHAVEYAAQAMAVHGTLLAGRDDAPKAGYLASVRGVQLHRDTIEAADAPLRIRAERLSGDGGSVLYQFRVEGARGALADGRAAAVLDATAATGGAA
ncbi:MAG: hydroxymyristoyl-ACP dehydratase [Hydrogenophaga sp.]|uniref:hydroxymyristoyl-ACP dehydratase n=1 Tax=Hydrogenophaga sp. TaxID=1904254 RepID=UPI0025800C7F|nr:hydroxymyristoyl-ACP dehydratase [Hydrogenophaga sp.]MBL0944594.1 hydroxymyristoyl-ACP dehydratase [Hydrogenophaga sp.]